LIQITVAKIDVTSGGEATGQLFGIRGFPALLRFSNGKYTKYKGQRSIQDLVTFSTAAPSPSDEYGMPNAYLNMLNPMNLFQSGNAWFQGNVKQTIKNNPCVLLVTMGFAMLMILVMGYLSGQAIRNSNVAPIWIRFPQYDKFVRLGLSSLDPEWLIKSAASLGLMSENNGGYYYVNAKDNSKQYPIPRSMMFNPPPPPPPPPPPAKD